MKIQNGNLSMGRRSFDLGKNGLRGIAFTQIFLLVMLSFAVAFVIGDGIGGVNAQTTAPIPNNIDWDDGGKLDKLTEKYFSLGSDDSQPPVTDNKNGNNEGGGDITESISGLFAGKLFEDGKMGALAAGVAWGVSAGVAVKMASGFFGLDEGVSNAASYAAAAGFFSYNTIDKLVKNDVMTGDDKISGFLVDNKFLVSAGVAAAVFVLMYKKENQKTVKFQCLPWQPPLGGDRCEECNNDPLRPCSEYRCKSLGQACELLNTGTNEERCAWVNPGDVNSPIIEPWDSALKPSDDLKYTPDNAIRPPNRGVKIVKNNNDCLEPFTKLEFGLTLNEPAQCKLDFDRNNTFETMQYFMGESNYFRYNHTEVMKLPSLDEDALGAESPLIENGGEMSLFVKCMDANGNQNEDAFVFTFCVDESPDTTPPLIEGSSIENGGAVSHDADSVPIELYVNEPSECKWSRQDKTYEQMENTMSCETEAYQVNANLQYTCSSELTGITNTGENDFYFRCKDQPSKQDSERNVNVESYKLTLRGSQELNILEITPKDEAVSGSAETIPVELYVRTDDGADEGEAICYFSRTGEEDSYVSMFETDNYEHRQVLDLAGTQNGAEYTYHVKCVDAGGNSAESETTFSVVSDRQAPSVVRAYQDIDALKIVTNEDAECVYSSTDCNYVFDEGNALRYSNPDIKDEHFVEWSTNDVYNIKCRDLKGNEPSPNECSIIVKGVDLD